MNQRTFNHRPVYDSDLPLICSFPVNARELYFMFPKAVYPLTPEQLKGAIESRSDSTVALLDGRPAAFANFYQWERGGTCSIGNVIVDPEARGMGAAAYLVKTMIDIAATRHAAREVQLDCFNHNTAGLLLYPKLGFKPFKIEERKDYLGERQALIHFRLELEMS